MHLFDSNNLILLTFDVGKTIDDRQHGSEKTQSTNILITLFHISVISSISSLGKIPSPGSSSRCSEASPAHIQRSINRTEISATALTMIPISTLTITYNLIQHWLVVFIETVDQVQKILACFGGNLSSQLY